MASMLLVCPQCSSSFRVPKGAIGDNGRKVRCSACAHEWLANKLDLRSLNEEPAQQAQTEAAPRPVEPSQKDATNGADALAASLAALPHDTPHPMRAQARQAQQTERKSLHIPLMPLFWLKKANRLAAFMLLCVLFITFRNGLYVTPLNYIYDAIGYEDTNGLQFSDIELVTMRKKTHKTYALRGIITNTSNHAITLPQLASQLQLKDGTVLKTTKGQNFEISDLSDGAITTLQPGENTAFYTPQLRTYSDDVTSYRLDLSSALELTLRD